MTTRVAAPYEILLADFAVQVEPHRWPVGAVIERKGTGLRARILEVTARGWWVRRLNRDGTPAQRATPEAQGAVPPAFLLYPVFAASEWHYVKERPNAVGAR